MHGLQATNSSWIRTLWRALVAWRGGLFSIEGETETLSFVFSIFDAARVGVYVGVHMHTHTHTAHEVLNLSSGVGTRHLEGPKNLDGLNFAKHTFIYVYKVHVCMYVLGGGMKSGLAAFFFNIIFLPKKQSKRCERKTENSNRNRIWSAYTLNQGHETTYCNKSNHHHDSRLVIGWQLVQLERKRSAYYSHHTLQSRGDTGERSRRMTSTNPRSITLRAPPEYKIYNIARNPPCLKARERGISNNNWHDTLIG